MAKPAGKQRRARGSIHQLPSGAFRVRVYAGVDPLTGKRYDLIEVANTEKEAEKVRTRLLAQLDERRNPKTKATVNRLMDRYLQVLDVEPSTRKSYTAYIDNQIRPALGKLQLSRLDGEVLDSLYAQLRQCRIRCGGKAGLVDHRAPRPHECDERCMAHRCRPMAAASIRQIHWILSGALTRAVRWRWISYNPIDAAQPPVAKPPKPTPPSAKEAARILEAAWAEDDDWGTLVWLVMTTGMRRGEVCALRRSDVDLDACVLAIPRSVSELGLAEKDTKTHQQRRIALDDETVAVLREHLARLDARAEALGVEPDPSVFLFSYSPSGDIPIHPSSVTHRYGRLVKKLGITTTLHKLRHYNATELIAAGVDIRTIAGRLGHGGGGTTTLRVYAAWVSEADQRAANLIGQRIRRPAAKG